MATQLQVRNTKEFESEFLSLEELKERVQGNQYLDKVVSEYNNTDPYHVPYYPRPVEFHISKVAHVTTASKIDEILKSSGWKVKGPSKREPKTFLWWSLHISNDDIKRAEALYMARYSHLRVRGNILKKFTKSPVFLPTSRYGNFKFTLPMAELMQMYKEQICGGAEPVLRTFKTVLFQQEIMYAVLVHSPEDHQYDHYPLLGNDPNGLCTYSDGIITWRAQAISETHSSQLMIDDEVYTKKRAHKQFYVWDHVTLAFHLEKNQTLCLPKNKLIKTLTACDTGKVKIKPDSEYVPLADARKKIKDIKAQEAEQKKKAKEAPLH